MCITENGMSPIIEILFIAFAVTIITTCIGLIRYPYAARVLATIKSASDANSVLYTWQNIGGYNLYIW